MSERLLEKMATERDGDTTLLLTPELTDTIETMERTSLEDTKRRGPVPSSSGGWETGMEVTQGVTLVKLIADGGMGSVWVADHARLNTQVAVKLVSLDLLEKQPTLVERLDREAAALGRLRNPNIVEIFDHGTTANGTPYIVMELLDGVTLWGLIKRHGPLSLTEAAAVVDQIANGLSAAHREGIIHRDIKPQNIFLFSRRGKLAVKVIDFGIAKEMEVNAISSVTKTGTLLGTPHFMSPEQLLKPKDIDARTDLWSLGVVAYHSLLRRFPFEGETLAQLFSNITTASFPPPSTHGPHLPPELDEWMHKALSREAQERFATAREMSVAFKRVVLALDQDVASVRASAPPVQEASSPAQGSHPSGPSQRSAPPRPSRPSRGSRASRPGADPQSVPRAVTSSPAHGGDKKLLPYPFALMQDEDTLMEEVPQDLLSDTASDEDRLRKMLIAAAVLAVVAIVIVALAR